MSDTNKTLTALLSAIHHCESFECGSANAKKQFAFDDGYLNLNHGSYGTYPLPVRNVLRYYQEQAEAQPDTFVRYEFRPKLLDESRTVLARHLDIPVDSCVYTVNASMGIDTVLRNLAYRSGDVILCFSSIYGSFRSTIQHLTDTTPVESKVIDLVYPPSWEVVVRDFEGAVKQVIAAGKKPRVAVFDTISSLPGILMPFAQLTQVCRNHNVLSCVDGAHGVGHLHLDLRSLDPDFFTSNLHKWLHVPRGCAVLYTPERNQHLLRTTFPTGFGFVAQPDPPNYVANFASLGTLDDTPYLCIEAALEWRKKLTWDGRKGEDAIIAYTHYLARAGGQEVAAILGSQVMENDEGALGRCGLTNVRLPVNVDTTQNASALERVGRQIQKSMAYDHRIAVNVFVLDSAIWTRLSSQVYLNLEDFKKAGYALKLVCKEASLHKTN